MWMQQIVDRWKTINFDYGHQLVGWTNNTTNQTSRVTIRAWATNDVYEREVDGKKQKNWKTRHPRFECKKVHRQADQMTKKKVKKFHNDKFSYLVESR